MCGATGAESKIQAEDIATLQQYDQEQQQQYARQTELYAKVNSVLQPILAAGPNQRGFSDEERNNLNAQAVEGTAENYQAAARAVNEHLAAQGGGNTPITTGGAAQLQAEVAQSAVQQESKQESDITSADYEQGYREFENAETGEMAIAAGENPLGYMSAVTNQENAAGNEANQIAQQNNSWVNALIGAAGSIGEGAAMGFCPAAGTRMQMADGSLRLIQDLRVGEKLRGIGGEEETIEEIQSAIAPTLIVKLANDMVLRCSPTHAFALPLGGFAVAAKAMGMVVRTKVGNSRVAQILRAHPVTV